MKKHVALVASIVVWLSACSGEPDSDSSGTDAGGVGASGAVTGGGAGTGGAAIGGATTGVGGGAVGVGGTTAGGVGGTIVPGVGGVPSGGMSSSMGGQTSSAGGVASSAGGTTATGGVTSGTGGTAATGGVAVSSGGTAATGGVAVGSGGIVGAGGSTGGSAGSVSAGGSADTGGSAGAGGSAGDTGVGGTVTTSTRTRVLFNDDWRFTKDDPAGTNSSELSYNNARQWVLPTGNDFLSNSGDWHQRPAGNLGDGVSYVSASYDDSSWRAVTLPHDYAVEGPYTNSIPANMGRLPATGVAWYRKTFTLPAEDAGRSFFIDIEGAMSYSMVWVNGQIAGGWPYGYSSYQLDVTPYVTAGAENVIAVRLDNPVPAGTNWDQGSSRWYPGAGIYRDVWLVTTDPVHVAQWGTYVRTPQVSAASATVDLDVTVDNDSSQDVSASVTTDIYQADAAGSPAGTAVASIGPDSLSITAGGSATAATSGSIANPLLWGVPPSGDPNLYVAVTTVSVDGTVVDEYETPFGVRTFDYDPNQGLFVNGQHVKIQGVCNHHDLGALGAAAYPRGKERQLEILREMGVNAVRMAHNPEAPVLYDLADRMGFLIMDEAFDVWFQGKTDLDHHLFFADWHEQDLRAMIRRGRNHPSIFMWSIGNEVPEQYDGSTATAQSIRAIANDEDPTRPTTTGMNAANPGSAFADAMEAIGLNYQGSGVRDAAPEYPDFHSAYPNRFLIGTETTDAYSSRGVYTFPVVGPDGEPASDGGGLTGDGQVSSYDLYHADWSYVPELEFESQDRWAYVSGDFVWTGFDHLGEPDPHSGSGARSSYCGILDLAGFPKDRFYLYQSYWRQDLPMAHILPHWTWPERVGQTTPVMVYTSGDEAELFVNGQSQGRQQKGQYEYRLRWDNATYQAGEVSVVAYRNGQEWATETVETAGDAAALELSPDRTTIRSDGRDLCFIKLTVVDSSGRMNPRASNSISFSVSGPGEIVATDNGDAMDRNVFSSAQRDAFNGLALAIVRAQPGQSGQITVTATSSGLTEAQTTITAQ